MIQRTIMVLALICQMMTTQAQQSQRVDVCVYGGTSAGVIAAYTASKAGKSVLLIEPGKHLGGLTSGGLGYTDIGNKYAVTGLARDFYRRIGNHYGKFEQWIFEPHVAEKLFREYISRSQVKVMYEHRIVSAKKNSARSIESIVLENSINAAAPAIAINARVFIDCSYEGDLMARAGVSYTVGREDNALYNETYNGVQVRDKHQFKDGIDPYKTPGKPESGLLWGISPEVLPPNGTGDKKVQAYNFRICLTDNPDNKIEITQPEGYDSSRYELLIRVLQAEPNRPFNMIMKPDFMPNRKTDINNNGPFSTDMIGMNYTYPDATYAERARITKEHEQYIKGFLYFVGHSGRVPRHIKDEMLRWGYPKDEYQDNGGWSHQMYVREARRMIGAYVMTQANCEGKARVDDAVGMAAYTMDSHNTSRVVINGMVKNEGDVQVGGFPPYPISYRSLVPKENECTNLLVPVCLSATHIAYGSIRMEPVFMVLAQSSAVAAVQSIDKKVSVQQVDVKAVQQILRSNPLADNSVAEVLIDNDDTAAISVTGNWSRETQGRGSYGPSLLIASSSEKGSVKFTPSILKSGKYNVYAYFPRIDDASKEIEIAISSKDGIQRQVVRPNEISIVGQTSGEWISVGSYFFNEGKRGSVELTTTNANGVVVADAVLFVPSK